MEVDLKIVSLGTLSLQQSLKFEFDFSLSDLNTLNISNFDMAQMMLEFKNLRYNSIKLLLRLISQVMQGGETIAKPLCKAFKNRFLNYSKHISKPGLAEELVVDWLHI